MNKNLLIAGAVIIMAAAGTVFYIYIQSTPNDSSMKKNEQTSESDKITGDEDSSSRYVEYSKAALEQAAINRRVLYFYANWCPTCRPTDAEFRANTSKIPGDLTVIRVNYNDTDTDQEEKDLANKYAIIYQHTFVQIDSQGNEIKKWNGGGLDELTQNTQ